MHKRDDARRMMRSVAVGRWPAAHLARARVPIRDPNMRRARFCAAGSLSALRAQVSLLCPGPRVARVQQAPPLPGQPACTYGAVKS